MDPKDLAAAAKALTKPMVKLLEAVQSGIGALGRPLIVILNEHAEGRAKLIRAGYDHRLALLQARNAMELSSVTTSGYLLPEHSGELDIEVLFEESEASELQAAQAMETQQQTKRRANVITIAAEAADALPNEVDEEAVDPDFIARFFSYAQDVSNAELQKLWGRILAGEVHRPGATPLRTLDILRNLSYAEAKALQRLASRLSLNAWYLPYGKEALLRSEVRALQDAGLVQDAVEMLQWKVLPDPPTTSHPMNGPPGIAALRYSSGHSIEILAEQIIFSVSVLQVRPSALPLLKIIQSPTNCDYLAAVVAEINTEKYLKATLIEPAAISSEAT